MKTIKLLLLVALLLISGNVFAQSFLNLDFEIIENGMAKGWRAGGDGYNFSIDSTGGFMNKNSVCVEKSKTGSSRRGGAGIVAAVFPVNEVKGKKIVFSGFVKTEDVKQGYAGLWWRVDGSEKKILFFDNMAQRGAKGTEDWRQLIIESKIDDNAINISYGFLLVGDGKAMFNGLQVEVDGQVYKEGKPPKAK